MTSSIFHPLADYEPTPGERHKIYRFANGYGASVIRSAGTHSGADTWEVAVQWYPEKDSTKHCFCYHTEVTYDVRPNCTDKDVEEILSILDSLPGDHKCKPDDGDGWSY